ncbi:MAG: ABC transporter ATP-binding protein [Ancrocorticia sp.]|nr:ABC transporter ATP-binding protein [Ancrocorticia sp.]MCI2193739.1 ABC transporter ATP-binding protein [Ancrocorticia sp.]MCI2199293.1 ABC transporter ATP-binding protein [Ancrocorticia sp.]
MSTTTQNTPSAATPESAQIPAVYRLTDVKRSFTKGGQKITPLKGINLEVKHGEFITIQGPTGGGKSTLLQLMGALDRPTEGHVLINGLDTALASNKELTELRRTLIGFVFQSFNLLPTLSARENVNVALEGRGLARDEREDRITAALARVGLAHRGDHKPNELSGGEQQRVAVARAIIAVPQVLLADEPTGNLDEAMRDDILQLFDDLNREGLTIVAVTHDSAVARRAHRPLRLDHSVLRSAS